MIWSKKRTFLFSLGTFIVGYVTSCSISAVNDLGSRHTLPQGKEIASALSPDQTFKAIVWYPTLEGGLGATISQPYQVWIQIEKGKGRGEGKDVKTSLSQLLAADKGEVRVKWIEPYLLEICYDQLSTYEFINRFTDTVGRPSMDELNIKAKEGEVVLRKVKRIDDC
jgi:hypothetical protein